MDLGIDGTGGNSKDHYWGDDHPGKPGRTSDPDNDPPPPVTPPPVTPPPGGNGNSVNTGNVGNQFNAPPPLRAIPYASRPNDFLQDLAYLGTFSPDMILQYVSTALSDIDGQIADIMGDAKEKKVRSEALRQFQNAVRSLVGCGNERGSYDTTGLGAGQSIENGKAGDRLDKAMNALKDHPDLVNQLQALKEQIFRNDGYGSKISADSLQNHLEWAKNELTSLNSENELTMMRLNQLVQARSQRISAASNEMSSINEGMKTVIGNMRA
jgi:hypothetical protein